MENIFKFIKDPTLVGAYCLKNPERIVAFGYILLMRVQKKKCEEWILSKELDKNQKRILNLAGNVKKNASWD